ncbi:MAG: CotH kinase family protein [Muribaculaceae bacterium]|nr:CotH kinase family protein [Muribaculaceae bacterium]
MRHLSSLLTTFLCLFISISAKAASGTLIINELMQSNIDLIMDDLNEFPDSWVELYNPGDSPVELSNYSISDKDKPAKAFKLPWKTVAPGEHVVIYCDKTGNGYHTDFRLESGKDGAVYLYESGQKVDCVEGMKKQPSPNIAYGRMTDGSDKWGYMVTPTPGSANCGEIAAGVLGEPLFSQTGRVSNDPLTLTLSVHEGSPVRTVIRYTLDGSEPTEESSVYSTPLNISESTVVRAKLFCDGYVSPRSTTQSYIFHPREMAIPIVSIVSDDAYFNDSKIGIFVVGDNPDDPNYGYDWRRPVNIEMFEKPENESVINQLCETRVKGGSTRASVVKSIIMYANKRFGEKRLDYEFFPEDAPGLTDWKSIELRNGGNDFEELRMRDAVIQRSMGTRVDIDWQPCRPVALYINGKYVSLINIRARSNEDNIYTFYDGLEDLEMWENWNQLKAGDGDLFKAFNDFYMNGTHTYDEYAKWMDVDEYMDVMILNIFYLNTDFPCNNLVLWRPQAEGGLWRWIAKDADAGLGKWNFPYDFKILEWWHGEKVDYESYKGNEPHATKILNDLMADTKGKDLFIDRLGAYMGDFLTERTVTEETNRYYDMTKPEFDVSMQMYCNRTPEDTRKSLDYVQDWTRQRVEFFYSDLARYFGLGKPVALKIDNGRNDDITITVNGHKVSYRDFDGKWWAGRTLTLTALDTEGKQVSEGWIVNVTKDGEATSQNYTTSTLEITLPEADEISIQSVIDITAIEDITADRENVFDPTQPFSVYDMTGRSAGNYSTLAAAEGALSPGIYLLRQGTVTVKRLMR